MNFSEPPNSRMQAFRRHPSPLGSSLVGDVARALALAAGGYIAIRIALALLHLA